VRSERGSRLPRVSTRAIAFLAGSLAALSGCERSESVAPPAPPLPPARPIYVDATAAAGLGTVTWCGSPAKEHLLESTGSGAAFLDLDADGDDDILVLGAWRLSDRAPGEGGRSILSRGSFAYYRNRGDGTFADETERAGLAGGGSWGNAVAAGDVDSDGDLDLYVANDSNPNYLYRNEGEGRFREIGLSSGAALSGDGAAQAGMGIAVLDFDGDRILDLFVTHFAEDHSTLYRGEGGLFFHDASAVTGVAKLTYAPLSWGAESIDIDQDAAPDLVIANGHIYPQIDESAGAGKYRQRNLVLLQRGPRVVDGSPDAGPGFEIPGSFRGLAVGDLEGDLDPDLLFTRIDETPLLLRFDGAERRRWLVVAPESVPGARWIGARIDVQAGGRSQSRVILSGGSYASQSSLVARFALGESGRAERVTVRFPGGEIREYTEIEGGSVLRVRVP